MDTICLKPNMLLISCLAQDLLTPRLSTLHNNVRFNTTDDEPFSNPTLYRQLVGSLIYLTVTRPDISHTVHIISQFISAPQSTHYAATLWILHYVKGTIFHGLHFCHDHL